MKTRKSVWMADFEAAELECRIGGFIRAQGSELKPFVVPIWPRCSGSLCGHWMPSADPRDGDGEEVGYCGLTGKIEE